MSESRDCCDRTAAALRAGSVPAPSDCETCHALVAAAEVAAAPEPVAFDAGAALAGLESALAQEQGLLGRLRAWPTWARIATVVGAAVLIGALNAAFAPRPDLAQFPLGRMLLVLAVFLAGTWAAGRAALWPLQRAPLKPVVAGGFALLGLAIPLAIALAPEAPASLDACCPPDSMFAQKAIGCLVFGSLCAIPALLAVAVLSRSPLTIPDGVLAASAGALCGQVGLQLHCPIVGHDHLLVGHMPVVLVLAAVICVALLVRGRR